MTTLDRSARLISRSTLVSLAAPGSAAVQAPPDGQQDAVQQSVTQADPPEPAASALPAGEDLV
jgi:hypothetical protein